VRRVIRGIAHVCLGAKDLAATRKFYCEGLGFSKQFDFIRNGEVVGFYLKVAEGNFIEVFRQDEIHAHSQCPIMHICFEVDDVDALAAHLKSLGYAATDKLLGGDNSWQVWAADPAGVRIEFHQYTPESTQLTGLDCTLD